MMLPVAFGVVEPIPALQNLLRTLPDDPAKVHKTDLEQIHMLADAQLVVIRASVRPKCDQKTRALIEYLELIKTINNFQDLVAGVGLIVQKPEYVGLSFSVRDNLSFTGMIAPNSQ